MRATGMGSVSFKYSFRDSKRPLIFGKIQFEIVWAGPETSQHLLRPRLQHSLPMESSGSGQSAFTGDLSGSDNDLWIVTDADDNMVEIVGVRKNRKRLC